jgi:hypothetical protein
LKGPSHERRQHVHELIDQLPPTQLNAVAGLLEAMIHEDRRRFHEGQAWFAQRGGKGIPMEDVVGEFRLKPEDFPLNK